jgi:hypothetical protein
MGMLSPVTVKKNYYLYIAGYTQPIKGRKMNQLPSSIRSFHGISSVRRTLLEDDVPTRAPYYCSNLIPLNTLTLRGRSLRFPTPLRLVWELVDWRVNGGYCGGGNFIIRKSPKIPFNPLSSTSIFHFPNKPLMENRNLISSLDRIEKTLQAWN